VFAHLKRNFFDILNFLKEKKAINNQNLLILKINLFLFKLLANKNFIHL